MNGGRRIGSRKGSGYERKEKSSFKDKEEEEKKLPLVNVETVSRSDS